MQLSKHFKLEEMTKSMTATRKGIDNTPGAGDIKNLENVCYEIYFVIIFRNLSDIIFDARISLLFERRKRGQTRKEYESNKFSAQLVGKW